MLRIIAVPLLALVSLIGYRIYGACAVPFSGPISHTLSRLAWSIPVAGVAAFAASDERAIIIAPFLFAALTVSAFKSNDMGRVDGSRISDGAIVLLRGFMLSLASAVPLFVIGLVSFDRAVAILGIGLFMPILFELGWRTERKLHETLDEPLEFAEAYWGAFYGFALGVVLATS